MTVYPRTLDELQQAPSMATLPALSACIDAVRFALDIKHPDLLVRPTTNGVDAVALALRCHLDECQALLRDYDELLFDCYFWTDGDEPDDDEPDDDIPF